MRHDASQPHLIQPKGRVEFRIVTDSDQGFLFDVFADTREWEFENPLWTEIEKRDFLKMQFEVRERSYTLNNLGAVHRIIQLDGEDIGVIRLNRQDHQLYIIDFALLSAYRGQGVGSDILKTLLNEAFNGRVPARLQAERMSPAVAFYQRHGFQIVDMAGHHVLMEWQPEDAFREI
ncbi:MAG: GNAT family N-acetyltransferase [Litorimonas sp.]